ncbi:MAG: hypothetical protein ACYC77_07000 [Coriobacteriia bacterium]
MSYGYQPAPVMARNDPEYVAFLERRIADLETRVPRTGILSPRFMTRAWTIYGHLLVAQFVLSFVIFLIFFVITLFMGGMGAVLSNMGNTPYSY